jgi:hypothetical protein
MRTCTRPHPVAQSDNRPRQKSNSDGPRKQARRKTDPASPGESRAQLQDEPGLFGARLPRRRPGGSTLNVRGQASRTPWPSHERPSQPLTPGPAPGSILVETRACQRACQRGHLVTSNAQGPAKVSSLSHKSYPDRGRGAGRRARQQHPSQPAASIPGAPENGQNKLAQLKSSRPGPGRLRRGHRTSKQDSRPTRLGKARHSAFME